MKDAEVLNTTSRKVDEIEEGWEDLTHRSTGFVRSKHSYSCVTEPTVEKVILEKSTNTFECEIETRPFSPTYNRVISKTLSVMV